MEPALRQATGGASTTDGGGGSRLLGELEEQLAGYGVVLLENRETPTAGTLDRLAVGPGGITLIDISTFCGPARVRNGRLIAAGGVDKTEAIDALLAQRREIEAILDPDDASAIQVKAALCWPHVEGSTHFGSLSLKGVRVDGPRGVARLARRSGELPDEGVQLVTAALEQALSH
jgi:hypothetical protein